MPTILNDINLGKVAHLKNALLETFVDDTPAVHFDVTNGSNSAQIGLICHYDGRVHYFGKNLSGATSWRALALTSDLPSYAAPNRILITDGTNTGISSPTIGIDAGQLNMGVSGPRYKIINLANPTNPYDAVNKDYVDSVAAGLTSFKAACTFTTIADVDGTFNGAVSPATITSALIENFDNVAVTVTTGMRVLVKNQSAALENGIYVITNISEYGYDLERAPDADEDGELSDGTFVFVEYGDEYLATSWVVSDSGLAPEINVDPIHWTLFSKAGEFVGGNGIVISGNVTSARVDDTTVHFDDGKIAVKPSAVQNTVLVTNTANQPPVWAKLNVSSHVQGILSAANGGTGADTSAYEAGSLLAANGSGGWVKSRPGGGATPQVPIGIQSSSSLTWTDTTGTGNVVRASAPVLSGSMTSSGSSFSLFANTTFVQAFNSAITIEIGGVSTSTTGLVVSIGHARTGASTYHLGTGATISGSTKVVNLGTGGVSGSTTTVTIGAAAGTSTILLQGEVTLTSSLIVRDGASGFTITNAATPSKRAQFDCSEISTSTTRTYTYPNASGTLGVLGFHKFTDFTPSVTSAELRARLSDETGGGSAVFAESPSFVNAVTTGSSHFDVFNTGAGTLQAFNATTTATILGGVTSLTFGSTNLAQTVNMFTASTGNATYNFATGGTASSAIKAINIGTGGASGSTTTITLGATGGASEVRINKMLRVEDGATGLTIIRAGVPAQRAQFSCEAIDSASTRTFAFQDSSGTLALLGNTLNQFAATTSQEFGAVISDETGNGDVSARVVFSYSPTFLNSVGTSSTQFAVFNTAATDIGAFGAAMTLNIAHNAISTGTRTINLGTNGTGTSATNVTIGSAAGTISMRGGSLTVNSSGVNVTAGQLFVNRIQAHASLSAGVFTNILLRPIGDAGECSALRFRSGGSTATRSGVIFSHFTSDHWLITGSEANNRLTFMYSSQDLGDSAVSSGPDTGLTYAGFSARIRIEPTKTTFLTDVEVFTGYSLTVNSMETLDGTFIIKNSTTNSRQARFNCAAIPTSTLNVYAFQASGGTLAILGNHLGQFANTTSQQLGSIISDTTGNPGGTGLLVFNNGPTLINPRINNALLDNNGNIILDLISAGSAVNRVAIHNSATGFATQITTNGSNNNIDLRFGPKNTGTTPSAWGKLIWADNAANTTARELRMCRTWSTVIGTGHQDRANNTLALSTSITVFHEFGHEAVLVMLMEVSTGAWVVPDWRQAVSPNADRAIVLEFKVAPTNNQYRVTIVG